MPSYESQSFSVSYDRTTKIISCLAGVFLIGLGVASKSVPVAVVGAAVMILGYAYSPLGYAVVDRSITIRRLIGAVRIPLDGIREVRAAGAEDMRGCIRLWGSGGLFGYYGLFRTSKLGKSTWYVTNRGKTVVVITDNKTALFSPDDVDGFISAVRASAPVSQVMVGAPFPDAMRTTGSISSAGKLIAPAVGVLVIAIVALAMLYSPGPPSYTLTSESLTIHDRFYPVTLNAAAVDVEHVRTVDLSLDADWRPTLRTNGFANAHYRSGWFRVANGKTVRMYRADGRRLVLLPPKSDGAAVLMEVAQPEQFVEELRRRWSRRL